MTCWRCDQGRGHCGQCGCCRPLSDWALTQAGRHRKGNDGCWPLALVLMMPALGALMVALYGMGWVVVHLS